MKHPLIVYLIGLLLLVSAFNLSIFAAVPQLNCAMCGKPVNPKLKTSITIENEQSNYCCPHCAIMALRAMQGKTMGAKVTLTDYQSGRCLSADDAVIVLDPENVLCCAPGIFAFKDRKDAQAYGKGSIMTWQEAFQEVSKIRCGLCTMAVYPPDAYWVRIEKKARAREHLYACCVLCAMGLSYLQEAPIDFGGPCRECGGEIQIASGENGKNITANPETVMIWLGLKENGMPAGCHFNLLFCSEKCVKRYTAEHPEIKHRVMNLAEAFETAGKAAAQERLKK